MSTRIPFQNLKLAFVDIENEVREAVNEVISNQCFILGPRLEQFEAELATLCHTSYCIGVGNGTDALAMALWSLEIGPDDEVLLPSFTFLASAHAVRLNGAKPVFVDIESDSFAIDPFKVRRAITNRTKAIMSVNLFGHPCNYTELVGISEEYGIPLVEDNAQAHGAKYRDKVCGGIGAVNATSFYPTKNLGAFGDGGAITTNNRKLANQLREGRNLGMRTPGLAYSIGRNSRLDEIQAAVLLVKLRHLSKWNHQRQQIANWYDHRLAELSPAVITPKVEEYSEPVWHQYVIKADYRNELRGFLQQHGIGSATYYDIPCHAQRAYVNLYDNMLVNTDDASDRVLALPCYPGLTRDEVNYVCERIREFVDRSSHLHHFGPVS